MNKILKSGLIQIVMLLSGTAAAQADLPAEVVNTRMSFNSWDSTTYVFVTGELKNNNGNATLDDLIVEARFFDANGAMIDAVIERLYSIRVPPGEEVAFRLQDLAAASEDDYSSYEVRLVSASEDVPCPQPTGSPPKQSSGLFGKLFISSFPILLLIALWIYFMRRYSGKGSAQDRTLDLIEEQNQMLEKQGDALNRIAGAMESRKDD